MAKKKIIAVGGGFASVKLALELGNNPAFEITLIAPQSQLEYHGALYRSTTGRSPLEVVVPFREIFADMPQVNLVNDLVTDLRAEVKELKGLSGKTYSYDAVVFGIGYEKEYFNTKGAREHTESMYAMQDALALRNRLRDLFVAKAGKACDIVVVGAGPTGIELAGDISAMADIVAKQFDLKVAKPKVTVVDRADRVLPMLDKSASKAAEKRLKEVGVTFIGGMAVDHCTSNHLCLQGHKILPADIIVWTAGSRANPFFERYPELFDLDPKKRVIVNEYLQAKSPNIYVVGDAASTLYSGMAQTAIYDGIQLATNFARFVEGKELIPYEPQPPIGVVPIGKEWAVVMKDGKLLTGADGWKIRRAADLWVLSNFLPDKLAKEHWRKGTQIAQLKTTY